MNYQQAHSYLENLQFFKIKLGLEAIGNILDRLDNPHLHLPCLHIAGTNGKGSVGATLLALLSEAGYRVGFYSSPHLYSVRERFRINHELVGEERFAQLATLIKATLGKDKITYFEFTTALALKWFAEEKVDFAILETGMGGRLDATNIVHPLLTIITNVSMDHEHHLGSTLAKISTEKAGIIKPDTPLICGCEDHVPQTIMAGTCRTHKSDIYQYGKDFRGVSTNQQAFDYYAMDGTHHPYLPLMLEGFHQVANSCLALAACELLGSMGYPIPDHILRNGLSKVEWPGRMERFSITAKQGRRQYLLDGAHNPAGIKALIKTLKDNTWYNRLFLVWGAMADKNIEETMVQIIPLTSQVILTQAEKIRSASASKLYHQVPSQLQGQTRCIDSVARALEKAEQLAAPDDLICVAGSLYLVGKAREILQEKMCGEEQ